MQIPEHRILEMPHGLNTLNIRYNPCQEWQDVLDAVLRHIGKSRNDFGNVVMVAPEMWRGKR